MLFDMDIGLYSIEHDYILMLKFICVFKQLHLLLSLFCQYSKGLYNSIDSFCVLIFLITVYLSLSTQRFGFRFKSSEVSFEILLNMLTRLLIGLCQSYTAVIRREMWKCFYVVCVCI